MAADGLITLPPPRNTNGNGRAPRHRHGGRPAEPIHTTLGALGPLRVSQVSTPAESAHYNELIATHHYLVRQPHFVTFTEQRPPPEQRRQHNVTL